MSKNSFGKEYKLKEIGTIITGNTPSKKVPEYYGGNLPWIKPADLDKSKYLISSDEYISDLGKEKVRLVPKGSVLVSCIGNIGKVAISGCELCTNQQINTIVPNTNIVSPEFLYYLILWSKSHLQQISTAAVVPLINKKDFSNFRVIIPSIEIQRGIVEKLENVEKLINYRNESIKLMDYYLESIFSEYFGNIISNSKNWDMGLLEDIAIFKTKSMNPDDFDENWYYVGLENIESQKGSFSNLSLVADNEIKSSKYYFNQDVVLYGKLRPYLNKVALPDFEGICSTDIIPISPKKNSNKHFIRFLLSHEYYVNLSTQRSTGANLPRVSPSKLKKFEVPIPPIELQNQFAEIVQQVEEIKKYQQESKLELENLFNNLMQKAFKGELVC